MHRATRELSENSKTNSKRTVTSIKISRRLKANFMTMWKHFCFQPQTERTNRTGLFPTAANATVERPSAQPTLTVSDIFP